MDLTTITGTVGLLALVWKFIDFLKQLTPPDKNYNAAITQAVVWVAGLAAVFLYSESQLGEGVTIGNITLEDADTPTKIIVGLMVGSLASGVVDIKKAIDSSDSSKQPPLTGS